jgi:hypothetical protein
MNKRWMFAVAMMLGSAITGAQPSPGAPQVLYFLEIVVSVDGVRTSSASIHNRQGTSGHVTALLGPDPKTSARFRIDAVMNDAQPASGVPAAIVKLVLSKLDDSGEMQVFATPVVVAPEGQISHVQVANIILSVRVTRFPPATVIAAIK